MKYSQAILVTCVAGAALVSAVPHAQGLDNTPSTASAETGTTHHSGSHLSRSRARGSTHDLPAQTLPDTGRAGRASLRESRFRKTQLKAAADDTGDAPAQTLQQRSQDLDARTFRDIVHGVKAVYRENKIKKWQMKSTEAAGKAAAEQVSQQQQQQQRRDLGADDGDLFTRDFDDDALAARMFERFRQGYRDAKAARLQNESLKATAKAGHGGGDADVSSRDLEGEQLEMRDFDAELSARMFERFRQGYRDAKAARLQGESLKATVKAGGGDATGDVSSRGLDDALDARTLGDLWNAARAESPEKKAIRLQREAALARGKAAAAALDVRDIYDELEERDFEEIDELD